jgi:2-pyrone-4,6-dicarboxylate lactonase
MTAPAYGQPLAKGDQMDTSTRNRDTLSPPPDPSPHGPTRFTAPVGAVDTHAHIVGDSEHMSEQRSYTPPPATGDAYLHMLDVEGMTYGVLVQISVHGTDNTLLIEMLRSHRERLKGVAVIAPDSSDAELSQFSDAGVVGLRMNTMIGGGIGFDHLDRYEAICEEMGWHLQFIANVESLRPVASRLEGLRVPYVIDHMGDFKVADGLDSPDWKLMLSLMADGAWTKLSGAYRLSETPPYQDTVPFARALVEAAPGRCVWGSDWPHTGFWGPMPNVGDLLDLLVDWAPDSATRNAILTTNAWQLYGFPTSS